jgi:hypothetical protein
VTTTVRPYTYYDKYALVRLLAGEHRIGMAMCLERDERVEPARINDIIPGRVRWWMFLLSEIK